MTINRETAIQWAKDAGFDEHLDFGGEYESNAEQIQTLINRAIAHGKQQGEQDVQQIISALQEANYFVEEITVRGGAYDGLEGAVVADAYEVHRKISAALAKHGASNG